MNITFRQVEVDDLKLIRHWIKTNIFVKEWYYKNKIPNLKTLENKMIRRRQKSNFMSFLVWFDEVPVGYIQCYDVEGWGAWSNKVKIYDDTVSLDYFIGDINFIHRGFGSQMICSFIESILKNSKYKFVMISPNINNTASRRCCEKSGLEFKKQVHVPYITSKEIEVIYLKKL